MKKLGIVLLCILLLLGVCACGEAKPEECTASPTTTQTAGQTTVGSTTATVKTTQKNHRRRQNDRGSENQREVDRRHHQSGACLERVLSGDFSGGEKEL